MMVKDHKEKPSPDDLVCGDTTRFDVRTVNDPYLLSEQRHAVLRIIAGTQSGKTFALDGEKVTLGRGSNCRIRLLGNGISREHAKIRLFEGGGASITDLDSTNGTYVNGARIRFQELTEGDHIQIGPSTTVRFSIEDIAETALREQQYEISIKDELTGVFNRRQFLIALQHEFAYAVRHEVVLSLILLDIDHFKRVNDTAGHMAGDEVLVGLARLMVDNLREEDVFARFGGEEFAAILRGQDSQRAYELAERLRCLIQGTNFGGMQKAIPITVSLGISTLDQKRHCEPEDMIREADEHLYRAKSGGRNRTASVLDK